MNHIMVDLETLGTRADSVILSIGAVKFDLDGEIDESGFYASVSIDSNHDVAPRHISEETLIFWMKQPAEAQKVFTEAKTTLQVALEDFDEWCAADQNTIVWSNGADFDIPMLAHAFHTHGMNTPWKFYNTRCFRTMKNLPNAPQARSAAKVKHHALFDALAQAEHLQLIWRAMYGKTTRAAA